MKLAALFLISLFLVSGCISPESQIEQPNQEHEDPNTEPIDYEEPVEPVEPYEPVGDTEGIEDKILGEWRLRPTPGIPSSYTSFKLILNKDLLGRRWQFSSSSGSWYLADIEETDWEKWGYSGYPYDYGGPKKATKKIILQGWDGRDVETIVEEHDEEVTSIYVITDYQMQFYRL